MEDPVEADVTTAEVYSLPECDFCQRQGVEKEAHYDGKTNLPGEPWGNMCEEHYAQYGTGLGLGVGQKLIVSREDKEQLREQESEAYQRDLENGDDLG
ncbi:hypothetical protein [Pseudarthrobacter defluvii]|uniref:hypothetical protein n=1 Tax=Pseudarthrobacter defluvii TaxID=410837 RepID=UPI0025759BA1|nr:hypothetical protein [Pseudarthrobacter defluvii]WJH25423.1 hypothetical protein JCQ34_04890 [Pseudarthrobacter defluvii]